MSNQRGTFAKRNREMKLKDRAREKAERRAARKSAVRDTKGPEIAWDEPGGAASVTPDDPAPPVVTPPPSPPPAGSSDVDP
jgi:hypothetical protein